MKKALRVFFCLLGVFVLLLAFLKMNQQNWVPEVKDPNLDLSVKIVHIEDLPLDNAYFKFKAAMKQFEMDIPEDFLRVNDYSFEKHLEKGLTEPLNESHPLWENYQQAQLMFQKFDEINLAKHTEVPTILKYEQEMDLTQFYKVSKLFYLRMENLAQLKEWDQYFKTLELIWKISLIYESFHTELFYLYAFGTRHSLLVSHLKICEESNPPLFIQEKLLNRISNHKNLVSHLERVKYDYLPFKNLVNEYYNNESDQYLMGVPEWMKDSRLLFFLGSNEKYTKGNIKKVFQYKYECTKNGNLMKFYRPPSSLTIRLKKRELYYLNFKDPVGWLLYESHIMGNGHVSYKEVARRYKMNKFHKLTYQVFLYLEIFKIKYGQYPDSLSGLELEWIDPFSNQPFKYTKFSEKNYLLQSAGLDGVFSKSFPHNNKDSRRVHKRGLIHNYSKSAGDDLYFYNTMNGLPMEEEKGIE